MSELERLRSQFMPCWLPDKSPGITKMVMDDLDELIATAEAKGVEEGLEKAAVVSDCHERHWLSKASIAASESADPHVSTYYTGREHTAMEISKAIRALQSKPVIIDRAGNTWQQVKPCPDCNKEGV